MRDTPNLLKINRITRIAQLDKDDRQKSKVRASVVVVEFWRWRGVLVPS